jgi:hypothetical protein
MDNTHHQRAVAERCILQIPVKHRRRRLVQNRCSGLINLSHHRYVLPLADLVLLALIWAWK